MKTLLNIFLTVKAVHSKPFTKIIDILLLIIRFVKSSDQTIIQIIRKNKSILMFLVDPSNFFTGKYLKPSQHLRWRSLWYHYFAACSHQLMLQRIHLRSHESLRSALWNSMMCSKICAGVALILSVTTFLYHCISYPIPYR